MGDCWLQPLPLCSLSQLHPDRGSHPHSVSQPQAKGLDRPCHVPSSPSPHKALEMAG